MSNLEIDTAGALRAAQRDILLRIEKSEDPERVRIHWKKMIDQIVNTKLESGAGIVFVNTALGSDED
ncbi:hypothetical protein IM25_06530 [Rhodococcus sp. p52]|uniref:hypothetical protein n=1 Tax=Rhodococcus sp. p52 TaxID=935199 RepID=UPI000519FF15|nr:hypothetical protein [Rhodococcus sp. p52]AOD21320.1 hypothetical protein IM25_06530 [Rhodococcus sp. p52]